MTDEPLDGIETVAEDQLAALRERIRELEAALAFKRNVLIYGDPGSQQKEFVGEWVAIPRSDFDHARAVLHGREG